MVIADAMGLIEWVKHDGQADCWPGRINGQVGGRNGSEMSFSTASLGYFMDVLLFMLGGLVGWFISRHYYLRGRSDSNVSEAKRESRERWRRSVNYFEHMLTAENWEKRYIENQVTWICPSDSSLKIVIPDSTEEFTEDWTERHPDPRGRRTDVQLRVNDSTIAELPFIHLDGGRILVPLPRQVFIGSTPSYFWESDSVEFKVGAVIGHYYIHETIQDVAKISDVSIVWGRS